MTVGLKVMLKAPRVGCCSSCKHLTRRTERVWQYLTTLNKGAGGLPKTESEAEVELRAELALRLAKPVLCRSCEREGNTPP